MTKTVIAEVKAVLIPGDDHTQRAHPGSRGSFAQSLLHSVHGLLHILQHERNARIHLLVALLAFLAGVALKVSDVELAAVFFAAIIVFLAEIFNTAIERTLDMIDVEENPRIKLIKDMAAGGVLVASVAAVMVGVAIFLPPILRLKG
jgi:diacylglycerol kinase (ATP)